MARAGEWGRWMGGGRSSRKPGGGYVGLVLGATRSRLLQHRELDSVMMRFLFKRVTLAARHRGHVAVGEVVEGRLWLWRSQDQRLLLTRFLPGSGADIAHTSAGCFRVAKRPGKGAG